MTPQSFARLALYSFCLHLALSLALSVLVARGALRDETFYAAVTLGFPGMILIVLQTFSVLFDVVSRRYGPRALKLLGIFLLGPVATIYIGLNHYKYSSPANGPARSK